EILLVAGIEKAKLLIITFDDLKRSLALLAQIRQLNPDIKVLVRTKDDRGLEQLKRAGATEVIPEVLEGSLMLVAHVLFLSDIPRRRILQRLDCERKIKYQHLHGFYYGEESQKENHLWVIEKLHAVVLTENSEIIGSYVQDLSLPGAVIKSLHRKGGEEIVISENVRFEEGDVVLMQGEKEALLQAETILLKRIHESPI
ncbi:MAG: NAD-binding protein, partial [Psychromonas sp.]|nr:NAD-binding protein [Psychromonas sp.]